MIQIGYSDGTNHKMKSGQVGYTDGTNHKIKLIEVGGADGANHTVWRNAITASGLAAMDVYEQPYGFGDNEGNNGTSSTEFNMLLSQDDGDKDSEQNTTEICFGIVIPPTESVSFKSGDPLLEVNGIITLTNASSLSKLYPGDLRIGVFKGNPYNVSNISQTCIVASDNSFGDYNINQTLNALEDFDSSQDSTRLIIGFRKTIYSNYGGYPRGLCVQFPFSILRFNGAEVKYQIP